MFTRCYAFMYDRISRGSEHAGLRDERAALLAQARGDTVEIGAGTGLNLAPTRRRSRPVPQLLDGVPSEPSHPGRDHPFEAVRRGRSPWCGPEGTRDQAADGGRPSRAECRLMAKCRNTRPMTSPRWLPGVDQWTRIIHRKLFPLQLDSRWFSSQVCFPLELGRGGRSGSGDSNGRHGSYMRFSDAEVRA
jgi:hypothetical protein